jgi:hypothetical protein
LTPVVFWEASLPACILSALLLALPREIIDQWPVDDWGDTLLDLLFFALGGAAVGIIF